MRWLPRRSPKGRVLRLEPLESRTLLSADCSPLGTTAATLSSSAMASLIGLDDALAEYGFTGRGQTVVVIDSGIAYDHDAFANGDGTSRVVGGWDFAEDDGDPYDDGLMGSHGTHVAGILAGDSARLQGVAPDADIVALRVADDNGHCDFSWVEEALQWVHEHRSDFANPITTINLSLGNSENLTAVPSWATLEDEFAQLAADGIFVSVAAGNAFYTYQTAGLCYPAVSSSVVAVASVDASGALSYFSQRVDGILAAPGRSILSSVPDYLGNRNGVGDDYAACSGSSMASPIVAGASMLLRQAYASVGVPNVSVATLYNTLLATARRVYDSATGTYYKVLDIDAALDSIMPADGGTTPETPTDPGTPQDPDPATCLVTLVGTEVHVAGTAGADVYAITVGSTYELTVNGTSYHYGRGDVTSFVFDGEGGSDSLIVRAASGAATAVLQPGALDLSGANYSVRGLHLENITVQAGLGTTRATLYDSTGDDAFAATESYAQLSGSGFVNRVEGFASVTAIASTGRDTATMHDSAGDDTLSISSSETALAGRGFSNRARYFDEVHAIGDGGGYDKAVLYGLAASARLSAAAKRLALSYGDSTDSTFDIDGFEYIRATGAASANAKRTVSAIDYVLEIAGKRVTA